METVLTILRFIGVIFLVLMVFNLMIIVHEWGHFLAGRWRGLVIDRFQIWFGKPIWKKTINGVQYGLGSIPAGGFVSLPQMVTMESIEGEVDEDTKRELPDITPLDKIIVAAAGPLFSFLLAVVFAVLAWQIKYPHQEASRTTFIGAIGKDSPAEKAGLQVGDQIKSIDGNEVNKFAGMGKSIIWEVVSSEKDQVDIVVERDGAEKTVQVEIPDPKSPEVEGGFFKKMMAKLFSRPPLPTIGVAPRTSAVVAEVYENSPAQKAGLQKGDKIVKFEGEKPYTYSFAKQKWAEGEPVPLEIERAGKVMPISVAPRTPDKISGGAPGEDLSSLKKPMMGIVWNQGGETWLASDTPLKMVVDASKSIYNTLRKVFSPKSGIKGSHLSGPAGIMGLYYDLFTEPSGWRKVIWFSVVLNVNLAILNLMPFPVLDGGHIVMATAEWIRRKPLPVRLLEIVQTAFVMLLFGFMIFITFKDVGDRLPDSEKIEPIKIEWNSAEG